MIVRKHYIFKGRVQGVGFRFTLYQKALQLKLTGWVKNLSNGDVEAIIQGKKTSIEDCIRYMNTIEYIRIDSIEEQDLKPIMDETTFELNYW